MSLPLGHYTRYVPLTPQERYATYHDIFEVHIRKLAGWLKINDNDILCCKDVIFDIIERVAKRRVYFCVFHEGLIMSEQNEISHYCFWILKLAPLVNKKNPDQHINAFLAIFLFLNVLKRVGMARGLQVSFNTGFLRHLTYAFVYRDLSKEAIMAIADALLTGAGGGNTAP